jgi:hypothetical protein
MESNNSELRGVCVDSSIEVDRELQLNDGDCACDGFNFGLCCATLHIQTIRYSVIVTVMNSTLPSALTRLSV